MKLLLKGFLLMSLVILNSCNEVTNEQQTIQQAQQTLQKEAVEVVEDNIEGEVVIGIYKSATAYAARTDYQFETEDGKMLLIEGNTYDDKTINIPDNMLEELSDDLEGPPGINPDLENKKFNIYYNVDDIIYKIELVK